MHTPKSGGIVEYRLYTNIFLNKDLNINESFLNTAAIIFELGLPVILIALSFFNARLRAVAIPILGAVTPALVFYAYSLSAYFLFGREEDVFVFGAMWLMSFFTYCLLVVAGLAVGLLCLARVNNWLRYGIGLVEGPLAVVVFLLFERVFL